MKLYRHGDLLIKEISKLPDNLKKLDNTTLAYGEVTGHHHTITKQPWVTVYQNDGGIKFVQLDEKAELTHQEHKTIEIEKGLYEVIIEKEFDPWSEEINKVKD